MLVPGHGEFVEDAPRNLHVLHLRGVAQGRLMASERGRNRVRPVVSIHARTGAGSGRQRRTRRLRPRDRQQRPPLAVRPYRARRRPRRRRRARPRWRRGSWLAAGGSGSGVGSVAMIAPAKPSGPADPCCCRRLPLPARLRRGPMAGPGVAPPRGRHRDILRRRWAAQSTHPKARPATRPKYQGAGPPARPTVSLASRRHMHSQSRRLRARRLRHQHRAPGVLSAPPSRRRACASSPAAPAPILTRR